jgi:hypothetical protein
MLIESFKIELPSYVPIIVTFLVIGIAFYMSRRLLKSADLKIPVESTTSNGRR